MTDKRKHAEETLNNLREEVGTSILDSVIRAFMRQKLDNGIQREKRKKFPWSKYQNLYRKQNGICPWCKQEMVLLMRRVEIDHKNPNEKDFNADFNLQLLHMECNRKKSAMSIQEQAKHLGTTFREILGEEG